MAEVNNAPTRKVGVGLIAGAITTVIVSVAKDAFGYSMSPDLAAALTAIIGFLASYFTPNATPQDRDPDPPKPDSEKAADVIVDALKKDAQP